MGAAAAPFHPPMEYDFQNELAAAIDRYDNARVRRLLSDGAPAEFTLNETGTTPLMLAGGRGYYDIAERLLTHGADTETQDAAGRTALHYAVRNRVPFYTALYRSTYKVLLEHGANAARPDAAGQTPLDEERARGGEELYPLWQKVLDRRKRAERQQKLRAAARAGDAAAVQNLLNKGAQAHLGREEWELLLSPAATEAHAAVINTLLAAGLRADMPLRSDGYRETPLMLCMERGAAELVARMLATGAALPPAAAPWWQEVYAALPLPPALRELAESARSAPPTPAEERAATEALLREAARWE